MFRSFTVKNFRCFRDLTVEPLARVNLIAGKNNVGKTALLEALFLHAGASNPLVSININTFRGMELSSTDVRDLWGWLFYGKRMEETIELTSIDVNGLRRQLHVTLAAPTMTVITPPTSGQAGVRDGDSLAERRSALSTAVLASKELMMHYEDSGGRASLASLSAVYEGDRLGLQMLRPPIDPYVTAVFLTTRLRAASEDAAGFSRMVEQGRDEELLETLRVLDPNLQRLMVLIVGGIPMVSGIAAAAPPIPLSLMGEGLVRLLSILLAIADAPGGMVLIDEIENGLHYSTLADVWRVIGEAAQQSDTQVFATTHSWECIRAANEALGGGKSATEFRYLRLERDAGEIHAVPFKEEALPAAIEMGLEVR